MTAAPAPPPVHMRRNAFDPVPEFGEIREGAGVRRSSTRSACRSTWSPATTTSRRCCPITRTSPIRRPPGFVVPGAPVMPEEEQASARAGNLLGLDPPEHQRLRRMLTPEFTIRRIKRLEPRIAEIVTEHLDAMEAAGAPVDLVESLRPAHPVAGDLRAAGRPVRRPRRLPEAQRTPTRLVAPDPRTVGDGAPGPRLHAHAGG